MQIGLHFATLLFIRDRQESNHSPPTAVDKAQVSGQRVRLAWKYKSSDLGAVQEPYVSRRAKNGVYHFKGT